MCKQRKFLILQKMEFEVKNMRHYWCGSPFFSDIDYKLESDYDDDMPKYELSFGAPESVTAIHTDISLSHLIFLKAVALDRMDKILRIDKYYGNSAATDFYKELELLLADC